MQESEPDVITVFNRNSTNASISTASAAPAESADPACQISGASSTPPPNLLTYSPGRESNHLSMYYDMSRNKYLIIFNHFKYHKRNGKQMKERKGTGADVKRLTETFESLGFKVTLHQDLTHKQIMKEIQNVIIDNHEATSCIAVAVLTHGHDDGFVEAADKEYDLQSIHNKFINANNKHLINKPKLFFIQACRGDQLDAGKIVTDGTVKVDAVHLPSHIDFLTMYSSVSGHVSWRDELGSWLIQELCNAIEQYRQDDILRIITMANREIAYKRASNTPSTKDYHNKKQMPETQFTLTKILKF